MSSSQGAPPSQPPAVSDRKVVGASVEQVLQMPIAELDLGANIRDHAHTAGLDELKASIQEVGVIQPVIILDSQEAGSPSKYRVIDGHRRVFCARSLNMKSVPVIVRAAKEQEVLVAQLTANLHREGLTELDEARAFETWLKISGRKQQELAKALGKSPAYVSNRLRLLKLEKAPMEALEHREISASTAELLLSVPATLKEGQTSIMREGLKAQKDGRFYGTWEARIREGIGELKERQQLLELSVGTKHPVCPVCGGVPIAHYDWEPKYVVSCEARHEWDMKKGIPEEDLDEETSSSGPSEKQRERLAQHVKESKANAAESPIHRSGHTIEELVMRLIEQQGPGGVLRANYSTDLFGAKKGSAVLCLVLRQGPTDGELYMEPANYTTGEKTRVAFDAYEASEKKRARSEFSRWEDRQLRRPKVTPNAKTAKADPEILKGSTSEIVPRLAKLDREHLELLRDLEASGKMRKEVLESIDRRLGLGFSWTRISA